MPVGHLCLLLEKKLFKSSASVLIRLIELFFNFLFYIGVQPINNFVIVSGEQYMDSTIHTHVSILWVFLNIKFYYFFMYSRC